MTDSQLTGESADAVKTVEKHIKSVKVQFHKLTPLRSLNEQYFSDTLSWLCDPTAVHGLGHSFAQELLKTIAKKRRNKKSDYSQNDYHIRWGKGKKGRLATQMHLPNLAVIREFYLSSDPGRGKKAHTHNHCDLVLLDLDRKDSLILAIENKLFSRNSKGQLKKYFDAFQSRYSRVKTREFAYLTLMGDDPITYTKTEAKYYPHWIRLSWINDILPLINKFISEPIHEQIVHFSKLLTWLKALGKVSKETAAAIPLTQYALVSSIADCLLGELNRLGEDMRGSWSYKSCKPGAISIVHSSRRHYPIHFNLGSTRPTITLTCSRRNRLEYGRMYLPWGIHPQQTYNLIDILARDIYRNHFIDYKLYAKSLRRLGSTNTSLRGSLVPFFQFVQANSYALQVLFNLKPVFAENEDHTEQ